MKPNQQNIYFCNGQNKEAALNNPFMEPFKSSGAPVIFLSN